MIALLGHRDSPTDGVQDYCEFLARALEREGVTLTLARVDWLKKGWLVALCELWSSSKAWHGNWVVLQYTALAWSRHGFPFGIIAVVALLRFRAVRCGVVFHEPRHGGGKRWRDRIRNACQAWVMRALYGLTVKAIFADPIESIQWLPKSNSKAIFVPIGANIPEPVLPTVDSGRNDGIRTVAIFCITGAPHASIEVKEIAQAALSAASGSSALRFVFLGRGTPEAHEEITQAFRNISVDVSVLGLLDSNKISDVLANSDVMLFVRGAINSRRGSAIAGIAWVRTIHLRAARTYRISGSVITTV